MVSRRFNLLILSMAFMLGQSGCSNTQDVSTEKQAITIEGTISVYVMNYPLKYFAERIGGAHVEVHFPAPADEDPAYWMPNSETISKYQQIADTVRSASDYRVVFSHPVYQYFQRRYGLIAKSVHWEPDEPPTEALWEELKDLMAEHSAKWMIWEGEPQEQTKTELAALGVDSVTFAPCGNVPTDGDFLAVQRRNIDNLARLFNNPQ